MNPNKIKSSLLTMIFFSGNIYAQKTDPACLAWPAIWTLGISKEWPANGTFLAISCLHRKKQFCL